MLEIDTADPVAFTPGEAIILAFAVEGLRLSDGLARIFHHRQVGGLVPRRVFIGI
jgi:hypothetical protein